jgi:hypothetical protein
LYIRFKERRHPIIKRVRIKVPLLESVLIAVFILNPLAAFIVWLIMGKNISIMPHASDEYATIRELKEVLGALKREIKKRTTLL